jgi:glycosyltransferase involved in cell wall biosynthesis
MSLSEYQIDVSIVTPVLNDKDAVILFADRVQSVIKNIPLRMEIIFVLDPSTDGTREELIALASKSSLFKVIELSRRFGQSAATLAGISKASGRAVIVMDVDLQDPPELIPRMIEAWEGGAKIVLPRRRKRSGEPITKVLTARLGYKFLAKFADVPIPENVGDFRLLDREVVGHLANFNENTQFLRGLVALVGFEPTYIDFERPPRPAGRTKYNKFFGGFRSGMNGIFGFSSAFLTLSTYVGILVSISAFVTALAYAGATLIGVEFPLGNPTIVVLVLFMGGINLLSLGIVGSYVGRIYDEVKMRPRYIIKNEIGF